MEEKGITGKERCPKKFRYVPEKNYEGGFPHSNTNHSANGDFRL
jgi:hypothetical protein